MRHTAFFCTAMLLAVSLHAAEPTTRTEAASEAEPAVVTSPAAEEPVVGRGNPRRQEVVAGDREPAAATTPDMQPTRTPATQSPTRDSADRIELDATQITGNAELPRVMYVVPWKRPELGELGGKPARSLLDEVLAPVDREVFRRQNRYYEALRPDAAPDQQ